MFNARQVADIIGESESRVRYWAQTGFVGPSLRKGGRAMYTFQDLVSVKAAKELLDHGLSVQTVRRNLDALRAQLPDVARPLAQLRLCVDGERLVVLLDGARVEPLSGQLTLDLGSLESRAAAVVALPAAPSADTVVEEARPRANPPPRSAHGWLEAGLAAEAAGDLDAALAAYQRALALDAKLAAAHTNLGTLAYARGDADAALAAYQRALAIEPEQVEARFNLGNMLFETGQVTGAIAEWQRALVADPSCADACLNLGLALAELGAAAAAARHFERYLALAPEADDAARVRALLEDGRTAG